MSGSAAAALLCVVAGFAGSVQVAVMARFGDRVGVIEALAFATVLSAALYARFRSREQRSFADRMLSAMRKGFGGHVEPGKRS